MKKYLVAVITISILLMAGCSCSTDIQSSMTTEKEAYKQISQDEAKEMMIRDDGHIIVDVRQQDEYDAGHIENAILIPNESITNTHPEQLPDVNQIILVYCRTGNRSKQAAEKLANMGYKNVYEFGGINTWNGNIVK